MTNAPILSARVDKLEAVIRQICKELNNLRNANKNKKKDRIPK